MLPIELQQTKYSEPKGCTSEGGQSYRSGPNRVPSLGERLSMSCLLLLASLIVIMQGCSTAPNKVSQQIAPGGQVSSNENIDEVIRRLQGGKLEGVSDSLILCTVNGAPITMGDYRRQLRVQQEQVQASLSSNPQTRLELLRMAKERKIFLTIEEKKKVLARSNKFEAGGSKEFSKFLKDNKISKTEFDKQVLEMGLACKVSKEIIEQNLLRELINRELLASAAKANGFSKQAFNKFLEIKKSLEYQQLVENSGLTPEVVESELIKNQLCSLMLAKIAADSPVTDIESKKFYEDNKVRFKHGARVKLSQILIAVPTLDSGSIQSLRTQVRNANPKASAADIDKETQNIVTKQKNKAESLLTQARSGSNFVELANQNTEDISARQSKNGGDLGFQEESNLVKPIRNEIVGLKAGEVSGKLIESPLGFHIIKVTGKEGPGGLSYDECKSQIKSFLSEQNSKASANNWLKIQRQNAAVVLSPEFLSLSSRLDQTTKQNGADTP